VIWSGPLVQQFADLIRAEAEALSGTADTADSSFLMFAAEAAMREIPRRIRSV
jgi:hypothetical protein